MWRVRRRVTRSWAWSCSSSTRLWSPPAWRLRPSPRRSPPSSAWSPSSPARSTVSRTTCAPCSFRTHGLKDSSLSGPKTQSEPHSMWGPRQQYSIQRYRFFYSPALPIWSCPCVPKKILKKLRLSSMLEPLQSYSIWSVGVLIASIANLKKFDPLVKKKCSYENLPSETTLWSAHQMIVLLCSSKSPGWRNVQLFVKGIRVKGKIVPSYRTLKGCVALPVGFLTDICIQRSYWKQYGVDAEGSSI